MTAKKARTDKSSDAEIERASQQIAARLRALGISLTGTERPDELVDIEEAVERFEEAVEASGGDLMVDEGVHGAATEPDDLDFALPLRKGREPIAEYLERVAHATALVRRHPPIG